MAVEIKNIETIKGIFEQHGGIMQAKAILASGIGYYQLSELLSSGQLVKLKRGLYRWTDIPVAEQVEVSRIVEKGVYCLYSAAFHHGLTTFVSSEYHLAIPKKHKVVLPDYPPIKCYYWENTVYSTGIEQVAMAGGQVDMYNMEKTVCDIVRYQKKVGMDTMKEVLRNYVGRKDRNLHKLGKYAVAMRVDQEINQLITLLL